ncbi:GmrSD restriction endonuclease domain-containing protein [Demequina globuliformis]|uniref:GmrSD restriction endonuclease domain-containing protein n=1 Tax=Demequina globuliformis TaxID=676202 RepID=UPI000783C7D6|nr:DUF1524 domain-containing protein [Demequina globuliformis]
MTDNGSAAPGWYAPDPARPHDLRYWDGLAWAPQGTSVANTAHAPAAGANPPPPETVPVRAVRRQRPWWTSWPAIAVGFFLCVFPGLVLLWMRRGTHLAIKVGATMGVLVLFIAIGSAGSSEEQPSAAAEPTPTPTATAPSATPSPSPSLSATATPSPTASALSTPTPAPTPTPSPSQTLTDGTAAAALVALEVKAEQAQSPYEREAFGDGWVDVDRNGCDTRNDMLILRLYERDMSGSCTVTSGRLTDPFTGTSIWFERGGASEVDIDHLVALSAAWVTGASEWDYATRVAFANDPLNLEPVDAGENRSKGDDDASEWLPPHRDFHCQYVARQIAIKGKYGLWVTPAESSAMERVLGACPDEPLPAAGEVIALDIEEPAPAAPPEPEPEPEPKPKKTADAGETSEDIDQNYGACYKLPAGKGPYVKGVDPEYAFYQDRDGDGVVCE